MVKLFTQNTDPELANIVRYRLPKVPSDKKKFEAFKTFGQLTDVKAREALQPGSGPTLYVTPLKPGVFGEYKLGDEILINAVIVEQHRKIYNARQHAITLGNRRHDDRWIALVTKADLIMESIILHEAVHWGDVTTDGHCSNPEAERMGWKDLGHWFVHEAYGQHFAIERERLNRRQYKLPKMDIANWLGWGTFEENGETYSYPYDPTAGRSGPFARPLVPPAR